MRCSICDASDASFNFGNWHCSACEEVIKNTIGDFFEEDIAILASREEFERTEPDKEEQ